MGKMLQIVNSSSPLEQALIACETAKRGIGPQVYGCDEKGRVEEYVDCETLTHAEAFREDIPAAFASFHSMQLPLSRDRCVSRERGDFRLMTQTYSDLLRVAQKKGYSCDILETLKGEVDWLETVNEKIAAHHRVVFVTGDPNYMNRLLVKGDDAQVTSSRVKLIDYDCSCYSWRGIELGGHFICQMFDFSDFDNIRTSLAYPDESVQRSFLNVYLREWKSLNTAIVDEKVDCIENLLAECYIGAMFMCLLWTWFGYAAIDDIENAHESVFTKVPQTFICYSETKKHFSTKYFLS